MAVSKKDILKREVRFISQKRIILDKDELYQLYWEQMLSQKKIANIKCCSIDTVRQNLRDYNIPIHIPSYHAHEQKVFLNNLQLDYLYGAMLGDGCLYKAKNGVNSQFIYTSKSYQHVDFVAKPFENILYKEGIKYCSQFDKRSGKTYDRYTFRTITDKCFKKERELWYPDGIKHIPNNLKLNPTICLIWYIGDGGICNLQRSQYIKLSTQCFNKEEQEDILISQLSDFEASLTKGDMSKDHIQQYFILIPRRKMTEFLNYIGEVGRILGMVLEEPNEPGTYSEEYL